MSDTTELDDGSEVEDVLETEELEDGATEDEDADNPEGEPDDEPDDTIEIEKDGAKLRIPAALKDEFMLRADYTRKTQEVAEQRKALEAQITEANKASDEEINLRAGIVAVDAALQPYQNVDWDALEAQDPAFAQKHFRIFTQLQGQQTGLAEELKGAQARNADASQRVIAERTAFRVAEVQAAIPGFNQEYAQTLMDFGEKKLGISRAFMQTVDGSNDRDPILVKLLNALYVASQPKTDKQPQPVQAVRPAAKVKGGSAPRKALDDRMSAEDWVKQRNAQVAKRN